MRKKKKTAPQTRNDRKASSRKQAGLIARGKKARQSARPASALDNRSHRTVMRFQLRPTGARGVIGTYSGSPHGNVGYFSERLERQLTSSCSHEANLRPQILRCLGHHN